MRVAPQSNGAEGLVVYKEIEHIGQLCDKRIGSPAKVGLHYMGHILQSKMISCKNVKWILDKNLDSLTEKFNNGLLDAVFTYDYHILELLNIDSARVLFTTADYRGEDNGVFVASSQVLDEQRETVTAFLEWYLDALDFIKSHLNDEVAYFLSRKNGLDLGIISKHAQEIYVF